MIKLKCQQNFNLPGDTRGQYIPWSFWLLEAVRILECGPHHVRLCFNHHISFSSSDSPVSLFQGLLCLHWAQLNVLDYIQYNLISKPLTYSRVKNPFFHVKWWIYSIWGLKHECLGMGEHYSVNHIPALPVYIHSSGFPFPHLWKVT